MTPRCERNMAPRDEDCGRHVAYTPCGAPAPCLVDPDMRSGRDWHACERHADEAEADGYEVAS